jgi:hypothetical protein
MRRLALVVLTSAAFTGVGGLVLPAYGQSAGVGSSGQGSASTGGNASVGNSSGNTAGSESNQAPGGLLGGLIGVSLNLGNSGSNTSNGTSAINSGPATSSGSNSDTTVGQSGGGGGGVLAPVASPVFGPAFVPAPAQSAGVSNSGSAAADTGGNQSVGNDSTNTASNTQNVSGGLLAVGINLANVSNTSNGTSTINTGPADAVGNEAVTSVDQVRAAGPVFGVGGGVQCDGLFHGRQAVDVRNAGAANASTGNNASVGNQSTNVATNTQTVSGGLIALPINLGLLGGVTNASDGQSAITSGAATASGNRATTEVTQECLQPVATIHPPIFTPTGLRLIDQATPVQFQQQQLAHTGVDPFVMGLVAFALLFGGMMFLVWERVEALPASPTRAA